MAFDVSCHMDRFGIFNVRETGSLAPLEELANGLVVRDRCALMPDRNHEECEKSLGRFWSDRTRSPSARVPRIAFSERRADHSLHILYDSQSWRPNMTAHRCRSRDGRHQQLVQIIGLLSIQLRTYGRVPI
jgi:hypothetical protein